MKKWLASLMILLSLVFSGCSQKTEYIYVKPSKYEFIKYDYPKALEVDYSPSTDLVYIRLGLYKKYINSFKIRIDKYNQSIDDYNKSFEELKEK